MNPFATGNLLTETRVSPAKYYLFLFILWPFLALLTAIANFSQKEAKRVIYFFFIYYGLTLVIETEGYVDAAGYALDLKQNASLPFSDFFKIVGGLYATDTSVDIVEPLISFIVSRFTDNSRFLFGAYAAVFGIFYMKSLTLVHERAKENFNTNVFIHLAFFSLIVPVTSINGFRMWTAAWIFFFGAYHLILYRQNKYILFALSSCFVHWSFLSANAILLIYYFAGNRNFIYLMLALVSFVMPNLISPVMEAISFSMGGGIQGRFESYSGHDYVSYRQADFETASWFLKIGNNMVFYYLLFAIAFIYFTTHHKTADKPEKNLFSFLLLFVAFVNFGKNIPSFGSRFQLVFFLFATLFVILYFIKQQDNRTHLLTLLGAFPMLLFVVVTFRQVSESINVWILTPGVGLPWLDPILTIADLLF